MTVASSTSEGAAERYLGAVVGEKFVLRDVVGAGAMGTVYRADQINLGRTVAVKLLKETLASDPVTVRQFEAEARSASRLNHPNTISIIDFGQTEEGLLYLVMEFVRGRTLTEVIRQDYPLPQVRLVEIMNQVLAGLHEAHSQGVVHQDVKPDNILVERLRTGGDLVKIADFGIARLRGDDPVIRDGERVVCGTPEYMAPEQIMGEQVDGRTDVYAAGVVLYEMLAGQRPFDGGSAQVLEAHLHQEPPRPQERRPDVRMLPAIEELVMRALAKDPDARFGSAAEFRAVLGKYASVAESGIVCSSCLTAVPAGSQFCLSCGARVGPRRAVERPVDPRADTGVGVAAPDGGTQELASPFPLPFVGRDAELAQLRGQWTRQGPGRSAVVVGPPGSGKSALVARAATVASASGMRVISVDADASGQAGSWVPIRAALRSLLALQGEIGRAQLDAALKAARIPLDEGAGLGEILGVSSPVSGLEDAARRRECTAAVLRVLRGSTSWRPTVLIFDDVDRYDGPSKEILRVLMEVPREAPVHFVLIVSDDHDLAWLEPVPTVILGGLEPAAVARLVRLAGDAQLTPAQLGEESGGLPLYIEQLMRHHLEGAGVSAASTLADLVDARVEALLPAARRALQAVAVQGLVGDRSTIWSLLRTEDDFDAALEMLTQRGFVVRQGEQVRITHPHVRELVLSGIPVDARRQFHAKLRRLMIRRGAPPAVVGYHGYHAGGGGRVVASLERAGLEAQRLFDDDGAVAHFRLAWESARAQLLAGDEKAEAEMARVGMLLGGALRIAGDAEVAEGVLLDSLERCHDDHALAARVHHELALVAAGSGKPRARCVERVRAALAEALRAGELDILARVYLDFSLLLDAHGDLAEAVSELSEGLLLITGGEGVEADYGPPTTWRLALRLAELNLAQGATETAVGLARHAYRHAERVGTRIGAARAQAMVANVLSATGATVEAERYRREAVTQMRCLGDRRTTAELLFALASDGMSTGDRERARELLLEARDLSQAVGWGDGLARSTEHLRLLAENGNG